MKIQILENTKNISKKLELIQKYNLKYIGNYKCYKILNTYIHSDSNIISFEKHNYINDKEYYIEYISSFSFYIVEDEYIYDKYINSNYILKCYNNYITLELIDK